MRVISIVADEGPGGAQAISKLMLQVLTDSSGGSEHVIFRKSDIERSRFLKWLGVLWRMFNLCKKNSGAVFLTHLDSSGIVISLFRHLVKGKIIHVFHGPPTAGIEKGRFYEDIKNWALKRADAYIFVSSDQRALHFHTYPWLESRKSTVIHNPFLSRDHEYDFEVQEMICKARQSNKIVLLLPGRLSAQKNQIFALNMLATSRAKGTTALLLFGGEGEDLTLLTKAAESMGLSWTAKVSSLEVESVDIVFLGFRTDIQAIMTIVDVVIMPSLYEGFPLALVEAICVGARVISSDCPTGPSEIATMADAVALKVDASMPLPLLVLPAESGECSELIWLNAILSLRNVSRPSKHLTSFLRREFGVDRYAVKTRSFVNDVFFNKCAP